MTAVDQPDHSERRSKKREMDSRVPQRSEAAFQWVRSWECGERRPKADPISQLRTSLCFSGYAAGNAVRLA